MVTLQQVRAKRQELHDAKILREKASELCDTCYLALEAARKEDGKLQHLVNKLREELEGLGRDFAFDEGEGTSTPALPGIKEALPPVPKDQTFFGEPVLPCPEEDRNCGCCLKMTCTYHSARGQKRIGEYLYSKKELPPVQEKEYHGLLV